MRRTAIILAVLSGLLQACVPGVLTGDAATGDAQTLAGDAVATTTLADPLQPAMVDAAEPATAVVATEAAASGVDPASRPKARPETIADTPGEANPPADIVTPEDAAPEAAKSREQLRCEKSGGRWASISGGAGSSCVQTTRDGGKTCDRESDCSGQCLARSKTCAPYDPLWGCNEVLQNDGSRVTLCLN